MPHRSQISRSPLGASVLLSLAAALFAANAAAAQLAPTAKSNDDENASRQQPDAPATVQAADARALRESIERAVRAYLEGEKNASSDLQWLGVAAVPELIRSAETHRYDRATMRKIVAMICRLGGERAREFLQNARRSDDVLYRRAVASGLQVHEPSDALREILLGFTRDEDAQVRGVAMRSLAHLLAPEELRARIESATTADVAETCIRELAQRWHTLAPDVREALFARLARWALPHLSADDGGGTAMQRSAAELFGGAFTLNAYRSPLGRRGMLWTLREEVPHAVRNLPRLGDAAPGVPVSELAQSVAAEGNVHVEPGSRPGQQQRVLELALVERGHIGEGAMELLLEMVRLGYDELRPYGMRTPLLDWVQERAQQQDLPAIARVAPHFASPAALLQWLEQQPDFERCVPVLLELAEGMPAVLASVSRGQRQSFAQQLPRTLLASRRPEALQRLQTLVREGHVSAADLVRGLLAWESPEALGTIAAELREPGLDLGTWAQGLQHLLAHDVERFAEFVPFAYRFGVQRLEYSPARSEANLHGGALTHLWRPGPNSVGRPRVPGPRLAALFEQSLEAAQSSETSRAIDRLVDDLEQLLAVRPDRSVELAPEFLRSVAEHLGRLDGEGQRRGAERLLRLLVEHSSAVPEAIAAAYRELLRDAAPRQRTVALHALRDEPLAQELLPEILQCFAHEARMVWSVAFAVAADTRSDAAFAALKEQLSADDAARRAEALQDLVGHFDQRAEALLLPRLEDPDHLVRLRAASGAGALFSKDAVPGLLQLMRDPNASVRKAAKESLDQVRYYHEQVAHWKHWLERSGLDARSPAEALMTQAVEGKAQKIRLAAIRSLASLGEPTTLPFLIALMENEDAEIANAAEAAVTAINARHAGK